MASGKGTEAPGKGSGQRTGVAVVVPTTAGAIQVLGLRWSQRIPSSRVVLGNETSDQCERWTKDYNSLLRPGDPMRILLGLPEGGGCRLVVSAEIDHGRSWMVPIAAAHFADARAQAVHADTGRARLLIWGTGALDFSQPETADQAKIVENDYHLTSKIDLSRAHFATAAHDGTPVLCLLPAGGDAERAATILHKVLGQQPHHVEIVASLADVIRPITAYLDKGDFNAPPDMKYAPVPYTPPPEESEEPSPISPAAFAKAAETTGGTAQTNAAQPGASARTEPPPPFAPAAAPAAQAKGLSVGVLGGIAAALVAVIGVGAVMLRSSPAPTPSAPAPSASTSPAPTVAVTQRPQPVTVSPQTPPVVVTPSQTSPVSVTAPVTVTPPVSVVPPTVAAPPVTAPPPPVVPTAPGAPTPAPQPTTDAAAPVGRLTVLTPPAGSSCQAQVLEMNARYVETVVELGGSQPVLEIAGSTICGLAIAGTGAVQARFAPGTISGTVASLSTGSRIIFNPNSASVRLPEIAVSGGPLEKIELRQR